MSILVSLLLHGLSYVANPVRVVSMHALYPDSKNNVYRNLCCCKRNTHMFRKGVGSYIPNLIRYVTPFLHLHV